MLADLARGWAAVVAVALMAGCSGASAVPPTVPQETRLALVFTDLDGKELRPLDDPSTKAIALVFILRDCPIANSYLPELNRLHQAFADRGVCLLLVHADPQVTPAQAREHAEAYQIQPRVVLDSEQRWLKQTEATISPEAVVISTAGQIVYRGRIDDQYAGVGKRRAVVTSHDLRDALEAVLADQPVRVGRTEAVGCPIHIGE